MSEMITVILPLTAAQAEMLEEVLRSHCDEGPVGEGWQSPELGELSTLVETAISKGKLERARQEGKDE